MQDTHSKTIGYLLWIFGFMGAHRFYYGRTLTGVLWFFTLGLFFVGCDAGGYGVGTQQAVDSAINVAEMVLRYHRMHKATP